jgi:hypothetical protein
MMNEQSELPETRVQQTPEQEIEQLHSWVGHFTRIFLNAGSRKDRFEQRAERKGAARLSTDKKARNLRRQIAATKEWEMAENVLDRCSTRLSQLTGSGPIVERRSENQTAMMEPFV